MANRHKWTRRLERYLEMRKRQWDNDVPKVRGKRKYNVYDCPIDHPHAYKRGYCLISERQWVIWLLRDFAPAETRNLSDRAIWTKYGRVNGLRENGKVKRNPAAVTDSYESPNSRVSLVSNFGAKEDSQNWHQWLIASGCPRLGGGVSRDVYDLGDGNVVKVAKWHGGTDNTDEIDLWKRVAGTENAKFFAPIIAADKSGRWLVMKKADTPPLGDNIAGEEIVSRLRDVISKFGLFDIHYGNVGTINNQPVLIDYAR